MRWKSLSTAWCGSRLRAPVWASSLPKSVRRTGRASKCSLPSSRDRVHSPPRPRRELLRATLAPIMRALILLMLLTAAAAQDEPAHPKSQAAAPAQFSAQAAERFANLALACVHKEYPNKIGHTLN